MRHAWLAALQDLRACLSGVPGLNPTQRRVALEGALVVPDCAKGYLGRPVAKVGPGWHQVRIPLK